MQQLRRMLMAIMLVIALVVMPLQRVTAEDVTVSAGVGDTVTLIQGTTSPLALVTFMDGTAVIGTTAANTNGDYSKLFTDQTPGLHTYQIYAEDTVGRITDTVAISTNVAEHQQTTVTAFLPPTLALSDNEVTRGETVTVSGSTAPNAEVILYIDQNYVVIPTDAAGNWSHQLSTSDLSDGEHQLYAVAVKGGPQSYPTEIRTLIVQPPPGGETPPPEEPTPIPPTPGPQPSHRPGPPRITSPKPGAKIEGGWVQVCGVAAPVTQIELWNRGQLVGSVFSDKTGHWCIRLYLREFSNELKARACIGAICSGFSGSLRVFREVPERSDGLRLLLSQYRMITHVGDPVVLTARISGGEKPYTLVMDWGDGDKTNLNPAHSPQLVTHRFAKEGKFNGVATAIDVEGNTVEVAFSTDVYRREGGLPSWLSPFILPAVVVAGVGAAGMVAFMPHRIPRLRFRWFKKR